MLLFSWKNIKCRWLISWLICFFFCPVTERYFGISEYMSRDEKQAQLRCIYRWISGFFTSRDRPLESAHKYFLSPKQPTQSPYNCCSQNTSPYFYLETKDSAKEFTYRTLIMPRTLNESDRQTMCTWPHENFETSKFSRPQKISPKVRA